MILKASLRHEPSINAYSLLSSITTTRVNCIMYVRNDHRTMTTADYLCAFSRIFFLNTDLVTVKTASAITCALTSGNCSVNWWRAKSSETLITWFESQVQSHISYLSARWTKLNTRDLSPQTLNWITVALTTELQGQTGEGCELRLSTNCQKMIKKLLENFDNSCSEIACFFFQKVAKNLLVMKTNKNLFAF